MPDHRPAWLPRQSKRNSGLSHTLGRIYPSMPRRDWRMLMVAMAAVSARRMCGPRVMGSHSVCCAMATSSLLQPPSGPIKISTEPVTPCGSSTVRTLLPSSRSASMSVTVPVARLFRSAARDCGGAMVGRRHCSDCCAASRAMRCHLAICE